MKSTALFSMCTMNFILNLDKVFILEKGKVKETGIPYELLKDEASILFSEVEDVDPSIIKKVKRKIAKENGEIEKNDSGNPFLSLITKSKREPPQPLDNSNNNENQNNQIPERQIIQTKDRKSVV